MSEDLFKKLSNILSSDDISNNEPIEQLQEKEEEQECKHLYITDGKNEICQAKTIIIRKRMALFWI